MGFVSDAVASGPSTKRLVRQKTAWTDTLAVLLIGLIALVLLAFLAFPLLAILVQALQGKEGEWVWLANFIDYAKTPALLDSLWNSLWVSGLVTFITVPLAFGFAYALTRSCMPLARGWSFGCRHLWETQKARTGGTHRIQEAPS